MFPWHYSDGNIRPSFGWPKHVLEENKMLIVNPFGIITNWTEALGRPILLPRSGNVGGAIACVPNIGTGHSLGLGDGLEHLPQHGLLWNHDDATYEVTSSSGPEGYLHKHQFLFSQRPRPGSFPWKFRTELNLIVDTTRHAFIYQVIVTRDEQCPNESDMPLSLGLLPYFATHDKYFLVGDSIGRADRHNDLAPGRAFHLEPGQPVVLYTDQGRAEFSALSGFDQVYLQTSDRTKYVCVAPTLGKRTRVTLEPGESRLVSAKLTYHPK
jgi:galactose mutarotase-like enzyme